MEKIYLTHGIELELQDGGGTINSPLKITPMDREDEAYNAMVDAIESLVLAHACAGVNVEAQEYIEGLNMAIDAIFN